MQYPLLEEELVREKIRSLASNARRAAELAEAAGARHDGVRAALGLRLVRVGLRLAGGSAVYR